MKYETHWVQQTESNIHEKENSDSKPEQIQLLKTLQPYLSVGEGQRQPNPTVESMHEDLNCCAKEGILTSATLVQADKDVAMAICNKGFI